MAKSKVVLQTDHKDLWRIYWLVDGWEGGDDEAGGCLGELKSWKEEAPTADDREAWETWAVETALHERGCESDPTGFFWESMDEGKKALAIVKEVLKQERPLPDWAKKALAAGWKPPKGWKA
jgi:hypothetical protein